MTKKEAKEYIKSKICSNCAIYSGGGKCSYNCKVIRSLNALEQESNRDIEEIKEVINCDADAETKLKMIANIIYSKPHYFKALKQELKTEKTFKMRNVTPEEREIINKYIKSISKPTGINFWDLYKEPCEDCISKQVALDRDEKRIDAIDFAIKATDSQDDYSMGMRNGMRYVKSLIDGKEPQYESRRTDKEIKLEIDLGDEVVDDYGLKGVVVGIDTYKGEVMLSLLMRNHKVPQLVKASMYKKTGRHFAQIIEVLEQIKGEADGK